MPNHNHNHNHIHIHPYFDEIDRELGLRSPRVIGPPCTKWMMSEEPFLFDIEGFGLSPLNQAITLQRHGPYYIYFKYKKKQEQKTRDMESSFSNIYIYTASYEFYEGSICEKRAENPCPVFLS